MDPVCYVCAGLLALSLFAFVPGCARAGGGGTTFVRGLAGEPEGAFQEEWLSHLGRVKTYQVRKRSPHLLMRWRTAPVPAKLDTGSVTFVWTGVMYGAPYGEPYTLFVNGRAAVDFDVRIKPTRFPGREQGVELLYNAIYMYGKYTSSSGFLYLTVPAGWVTPGQSAVLEAKGKQAEYGGWFAVVQSEDAPLETPMGEFREFLALPRPPLAPPRGQEASYDWYKQQYRDISIFTPIGPPGDPGETAVSPEGQLIDANDNLNWTGRVGRTNPPYVKDGLVFALYEGGKIVPVGTGQLARQSLLDGCIPVVTTSWRWGDLNLVETAFAEPLDGKPYESGTERTLAWATIDLTNRSRTPKDVVLLAFYVGAPHNLRPKLTYQDGAVLSGNSAMFGVQPGRGFSASFAPAFPSEPKIEDKDAALKALESHTGVFNAIVVRGRIEGDKTERVVFNRVFDFPGARHWGKKPQPPVAPDALTGRSFDAGLRAAVEVWREHARRISRFTTPDPVLNDIVRKAMLDGYFLTKRWEGRYIVFDSVCYRCQYDDASTKWFYALDLMGDHDTAAKLLDTLFERQGQRKPGGMRTREGCFTDVTNTTSDGSDASWACCNGWALWAMAEHARLTGDRAWLDEHKQQLLAGCEWIIRERGFSKEEAGNPCAGLIHGRFVCDSGDEPGYFVYTDAISYLGLHETAQLLDEWGHPEGKRLLAEAEAYRQDIIAAIDRLTDKSSDPWYVPWRLDAPKQVDRYFHDIVGPINLAFGGVVPRDDERVDQIIRWIIERVHGGSIEEATAGPLNPESGGMFYSQDLAIVLLERGRIEEFLRIFYTLLAANVSHETFTTGEWGGNTQPHTHSIASLVRLFRTMLIQERDGALVLLQGVPRRWFEQGQEIVIEEAPTWYGPLSLRCASDINNGQVTIQMRVPEHMGTTPIRLRLRLPGGRRIESVTVDKTKHADVDGEWIALPGTPGQRQIVVKVAGGGA